VPRSGELKTAKKKLIESPYGNRPIGDLSTNEMIMLK
jgi:hypothetical protein